MGRRLLLQILAASVMIAVLAALLYWQHVRFQLVTACREQGGVWDGATGRCKLVPPIYLERGIKRSQAARDGDVARLTQNRSIR